MAGPQNPPRARFPIPPPVIQVPWGDIRFGQVWLNQNSYDFLSQLWAAIQGAGGIAGLNTAPVIVGEALAANTLLNIYPGPASSFRCRPADATDPAKPAHGFVLNDVDMNAEATVYFTGVVACGVGLTPGTAWLSNTAPGQASSDFPVTPGELLQIVGVAVSPTQINFAPQAAIPL